jgi:hypothetical protein
LARFIEDEEIMTNDENRLRELAFGMGCLSDRGREYIHRISQTLLSVQGSMVSPIPPEKAEGSGEPSVRRPSIHTPSVRKPKVRTQGRLPDKEH